MGVTINPLGPPFDFTGASGGGGGTIGGSIAAPQVAFGTAANTIGGEAAFSYNSTTNILTVEREILSGGSGSTTVLDITQADASPYAIHFVNTTAGGADFSAMWVGDTGDFNIVGPDTLWFFGDNAAQHWTFQPSVVISATVACPDGSGLRVNRTLVANGLENQSGAAIFVDTAGFDTINDLYGLYVRNSATGNSVVPEQTGIYLSPQVNDTAVITGAGYGVWYAPVAKAAGATLPLIYGFYSDDLTPVGATLAYYSWFDSRGVMRVREDPYDGAGNEQAILSLYNPRFTKYTAGATNFERVVQQWNTNVLEYGTEAGGTGTLRDVRFIGADFLFAGAVRPNADDGAALGSASLRWSDLFLAEGGVIDWDNGDVTITQTNNVLAVAGTTSVTFDGAISAASTATLGTAAGTTGAALFKGTTSGTVTLSVADTAGTWTMKLPTTAGTNGYSLTTDGSGNTTWTNVSGGSGATTALDNLASVAINTALLLGTSDAAALGSGTKMWSDLFLASGAVINYNNGDVTETHSSGTLTIGGSASNGVNLTLAAGGTSRSSLSITPGTLMTTPGDGAIEMDADCLYACTDAGNRGYVPVMQMIRQHADRAAFANDTNQQKIFDSVTNGTLTLETGTYFFDGVIQCKGMSATSGNLKFSIIGAGGATLANILWHSNGIDAANEGVTTSSGISSIQGTQTAANIATASIATVCTFHVYGSFELTVAGTIIPSIAQTTATTTAVITAGSYLQFRRVGATTAVSVGQWT